MSRQNDLDRLKELAKKLKWTGQKYKKTLRRGGGAEKRDRELKALAE